jgi:RHS repeat-associated protein
MDRVGSDQMNGLIQKAFEANGNLLTVTDANGHATTHTYDVQDRLETRTDPLGSVENYVYDFNGNLNRFTDRKGQVSQFTYDAADRRMQSSYADGSLTTFTYDATSRLMQVNDSTSGLIQMSYDNLNRLTQETTPQGTVSYGYDAIGRRTSMTAAGLSPVAYQYDAASRLTQVAQGSRTVGLGYDAAGRRTSLTYPNGTATNYFYDTASRLSEIRHQGPSGVIEDLLYTYDSAGNRIDFTRNNPQAELPQAVAAAYNAANQMTQFNTETLTYDANGNLTSDGTNSYTWDARNRLAQMSSANISASFVYDALGRRVSKTINNATTRYLYEQNDIVAEIQNNAVSATYLRGLNIDEPFLRSSAVAEYYHTDALGSTLALTDETGITETTYSYDSFGNTMVTGSSINPFQYTGRENDGAGLYYYRARYYSPQLERFISPDPLLCGSTNKFPLRSVKRNPQTLNTFAYVSNSPVNLRDPLGLSPECQYYDMRCSENSGSSLKAAVGSTYYCNLAPLVCEKWFRTPYWNCVRQCLQAYDNTVCAPMYGRKSILTTLCAEGPGHAFCFTKCFETTFLK